MKRRIIDFFDKRIDLSPIRNWVQHKTVPQHKHSFWYYFGGLALFLITIQIITGILLAFYYSPNPRKCQRIGALYHGTGEVWLADKVDTFLGCEFSYSRRFRPHVFNVFHESIPQAARNHVGAWSFDIRFSIDIFVYWISSSMDDAFIFRDKGRREHSNLDTGNW